MTDKTTPTPFPSLYEKIERYGAYRFAHGHNEANQHYDISDREQANAKALLADIRAEVERLAAQAAPTEEMSPEFTDTARAALLWVLWHHQGGSSKVGQPIRFALGMDPNQPLSDYQVREAKRWEALDAQPSQAPVVQAGEYPPLPVPTGQVVTLDMVDGRKARVIRAIDPHWMVGADGKTLFTEEQMRAYVDADRASRAPAVRMLTREELNDVALSDQVGWEPGEYIEAVQRKFCAVNAGRTIPASGEIGSV